MNVFVLRDNLIKDYEQYIRSFFVIRDSRINAEVDRHLSEGALWPDPLLQLNPSLSHPQRLFAFSQSNQSFESRIRSASAFPIRARAIL
jgi:hypothetical protein